MNIPPFHWWRTVFFLIPAIAVYTIVLGTLSIASSLFDRRGYFAHRCARAWSWLILATTGVRVRRRRASSALTPGTTYIFVSNHQSIYDIPIIFWHAAVAAADHREGSRSAGSRSSAGTCSRTGHLLVDRTTPGPARHPAALEGRSCREGLSLIVFPEGTRSADGRVGRVQGRQLPARDPGRPADRADLGGRQPPRDVEGPADDLPRPRPPHRARPGAHRGPRRRTVAECQGARRQREVQGGFVGPATSHDLPWPPASAASSVPALLRSRGCGPSSATRGSTRRCAEAEARVRGAASRRRRGGADDVPEGRPRSDEAPALLGGAAAPRAARRAAARGSTRSWTSATGARSSCSCRTASTTGPGGAGPSSCGWGTPGEQYAGIRKDVVHVADRLTLADARGPFGNPTSDSARTMVTTANDPRRSPSSSPRPGSTARLDRASS